MIEQVWISIPDNKDPIEVLQRAQDAMGNDGLIIALKPYKPTGYSPIQTLPVGWKDES
jgi:hypothetical protein